MRYLHYRTNPISSSKTLTHFAFSLNIDAEKKLFNTLYRLPVTVWEPAAPDSGLYMGPGGTRSQYKTWVSTQNMGRRRPRPTTLLTGVWLAGSKTSICALVTKMSLPSSWPGFKSRPAHSRSAYCFRRFSYRGKISHRLRTRPKSSGPASQS